MTAFYAPGGDGELHPSALAAGPPWLPDTQHGSMVTALMARSVEATPAAAPMHLTRLTVDMSRPVPMAPTRLETTVVRDGRRLQVLDITVVVGGRPCARGSALRIRTVDDLVAAPHVPQPWADDQPLGRPTDPAITSPLGPDQLWDAHDARWSRFEPGVGCVWLRPNLPLVEGEALSRTVAVAMIADLVMTNGSMLPTSHYVVINPDLTLAISRPAESEWIQIRSRVRIAADGSGVSEGLLYDERGRIGTSLKSLLVDRLPVS